MKGSNNKGEPLITLLRTQGTTTIKSCLCKLRV